MPPVDPTVQLTPWWVSRLTRIREVSRIMVNGISNKDLDTAIVEAYKIYGLLQEERARRKDG